MLSVAEAQAKRASLRPEGRGLCQIKSELEQVIRSTRNPTAHPKRSFVSGWCGTATNYPL